MKPVFLLIFTIISYLTSGAQAIGTGIIAGNVIDADNAKPLQDVTITATQSGDTLHQLRYLSLRDGSFSFETLEFGYYEIRFSITGYQALRLDSIFVREERSDFNLNDIKLNRNNNALENVVIYAEKPLFENKDGKLIFNAGESALSDASTATELLKQTPLVNVDADGKIQLKGKDVKILIDDKPVDLDSRQLQELLESMPGSTIEKIEVLTTPPPQYANERGGVINIVTKKGKPGASARLNVKYGTRAERGINGNASMRKGKWNMSLNAGSTTNTYRGNSESTRERFYADSSNILITRSHYTNKYIRPVMRFTADFDLNKYNLFNASFSLNSNENYTNNFIEYFNYNYSGDVYRRSTRLQEGKVNSTAPNTQVSYTHKGKKKASILKFQQALYTNINNNDRDYYQQYLAPDGLFNGDDSTLLQLTHLRVRSLVSRANFEQPLNKRLYFFTGGSYTSSLTANRLNSLYLSPLSGNLETNDLLSNAFDFYQYISSVNGALRVTPSKPWIITAGLTWEFANTYFNIIGEPNHYKNAYDNLLPFMNFSRKWDKGYNITGSYKRTVQRPGINNLNPSIDYSDQYSVRTGNPYLQPYLADNFDLGAGYWTKKYNINFSGGYNVLQHIYSLIRTLQPDGKTYITYQNLSGRREYEANGWGGFSAGKKLKLNSSVSYTYNVYSAHDREINRYRNGSSWRSSLNLQYVKSDLLTGTGNFSFNRFASPQGRSKTTLSMNLGAQRKFWNKNMTVSVNVIDPFLQLRNHNSTYGSNYTLESYSSTQTRNVRVAVAYNFRKKAVKKPVPAKKIKQPASSLPASFGQ
ncbi:MAG: outer membrane beta-barrel protein [Ferruginibacter sp.]